MALSLDTQEELANASVALMDWCESQELSPKDALTVLGFTITAILQGHPGPSKIRDAEKRDFMATLRRSLSLAEDETP